MHAPEDDEIDLLALLATLWRGKWVILAVTILALTAGGYYAYRVAVPIYTTTAVLTLDPRKQQATLDSALSSLMPGLSGDKPTINTEVEVMRSRGLIEKLAKKLNLTEDPEFNGYLRPENPYDPKKIIKKFLGIETPAFKPSKQRILDATVDAILKDLQVSNKRDTYVFNITVSTTDARKSALIANTLADLYILNQLDVKFQETKRAAAWLSEKVAELKANLERSVKKIRDFNAQSELVSPGGLAVLQSQFKGTRERIAADKEKLKRLGARMRSLEKALASSDPDIMAKTANDPNLDRMLTRLKAGELDRQTFDSAFKTLLKRVQDEYARKKTRIQALKDSIATLSAQIERQSTDLIKLQQLQQEAAANQNIYDYFLKRLKEMSIQQGTQTADSRVLSRAVVPLGASKPKKSLILALSGLLGLFAGAGIVLTREMLQNGFRTSEELEAGTGYSVLGQIPRMPTRRRLDALNYLIQKPTSAAAEAVRNLRTSILLSNVDKPPKVIMITSSMPGEGKTTISLALSQNMAGLGKKVLLVEGDIRRRTFSEYFKIEGTQGLLSVISGEAELEDILYRDEKLGFDVLVGEKSMTNAADIFSSERFRKFIEDMREAYDYVVIDTPPVLVVPDARVIAQNSDAVLYAVRWDSTPKAQVTQGLKMFETVRCPVTGLILSSVDARSMKKYGGYYGYYAKGYYDN